MKKIIFHMTYPLLLIGYVLTGLELFYYILAIYIFLTFLLTIGGLLMHNKMKSAMTREARANLQAHRARTPITRWAYRLVAIGVVISLFLLGKDIVATMYLILIGLMWMMAADMAKEPKTGTRTE